MSWEAALVLVQGGHAAAAEVYCREALEKCPDDAMLWQVRGVAAYQRDDLPAARDCFARVVELDPENADGQNNLAEALKRLTRYADALPVYERALAINPENPNTLVNYSHALLESGRHGEAVEAARKALTIKPDWVPAMQNLSLALWASGFVEEAIRIVRRAVEIEPDARIGSNLLMFLQYSAEHPEEKLLQAAQTWGRTMPLPAFDHSGMPEPDRLRIGYVSSDLRDHPVGYQMEKVLAGHDPSRVEVVLYSTSSVEDATTARLRSHAAGWRNLSALDDETGARLIAEDGIHVLIDLSGHTAFHRLGLFALRPAPVQASWLGYFATTGLSQIDFLLRDPAQIPPEEDRFYTERVWRMEDAAFGYQPVAGCPELTSLPARANGYVTFGCFANPAKISEAAIRAWARVLRAVPDSRMILDRKGLDDPLAGERIRSEFARHGIPAERIALAGSRGHLAYMARYAEVDVVLDTFPCNGATTTYEALWMGVPVVSHRWGRMVGHFAESILGPCGYGDWVAEDEDGYVAKATALACDLDGLETLRGTLRRTLADSPLCQGDDCARALENAYLGMWRTVREEAATPWLDGVVPLARAGRVADAFAAFERGAGLAPGLVVQRGERIFADLADALVALGRHEEAIVCYAESVKLSGVTEPETVRSRAAQALRERLPVAA